MEAQSKKLRNLALNTNKAGMEGLDTVKVNEIIQKASEGSKFYLHKQKHQEKLNEKIFQLKKAQEKLTPEQILKAELQMTKLSNELLLSRNFKKIIVHVDMDMYYAAVEMRDDPSLRDRPMAVGSTGMLSTSNYAARKFGVRAGMPGFIGLKLCPDLTLVPPNFKKYKEVSSQMQDIFKIYDPNFAPMSLDEAYLDITEFVDVHGWNYQSGVDEDKSNTTAEKVVQEIRLKIFEKTQLTASAGIAVNTRLAKVCSDLNKPNGQYYLPPNEDCIKEFIDKLPIRKVNGIGSVSEQQLQALGIETCSDLWKKRGLLYLLFSETSCAYFLSISLGLGSTELEPASDRDRKSISTENTFRGTSDKTTLIKYCEELCRELQDDMNSKEVLGKVFTLKLKTTAFQLKTRAHALLEATNEADILIPVALKLLQHEMDSSETPLSLRLLDVRMSNLCDQSEVNQRKQLTITRLFKKERNAPPTTHRGTQNLESIVVQDVHECPACCQRLSFTSLSEFNDHVLNCLSETSLEEVGPCCENTSLSINDKIKPVKIDNVEGQMVSGDVASTSSAYECPVCSRMSFSDISALNLHIDVCLNGPLVRKLVKESNDSSKTLAERDIGIKSNETFHSHSKAVKRKATSLEQKRAKEFKSSASVLHKFLGLK